MSQLELEDVVDDGIGPLRMRFTQGLHVCLADSLTMLGRLIELASGARTPRRGRALYGGADLRGSPKARRHMTCLKAEETLPPASDVTAAIRIVLALRGSTARAEHLLEEWGLAAYARSKPEALPNDERRALQLAVCLSGGASELILLHDPLALAPRLPRERLIARCIELGRDRTLLVTTDSLQDAIALGGHAHLFERGRISNYVGLSLQRGGVSLRVRSSEAQRLAEALGAQAELRVHFDARISRSEFCVSGETIAALSNSVARVATEQRILVEGLSLDLPSLSSLLSARAAHFSRESVRAKAVSSTKPA